MHRGEWKHAGGQSQSSGRVLRGILGDREARLRGRWPYRSADLHAPLLQDRTAASVARRTRVSESDLLTTTCPSGAQCVPHRAPWREPSPGGFYGHSDRRSRADVGDSRRTFGLRDVPLTPTRTTPCRCGTQDGRCWPAGQKRPDPPWPCALAVSRTSWSTTPSLGCCEHAASHARRAPEHGQRPRS